MSEYRIVRVSEKPPRPWSFKGQGGDVAMETYKVMFEGVEEPVDVNRKAGNKPQTGEVLYGGLEESDFGKKFKAERKPFTPGIAKDQESIKAQWAIGQAVQVAVLLAKVDENKQPKWSKIEEDAKYFYQMIERVKSTTPTNTAMGVGKDSDAWKAARQKLKTPSAQDGTVVTEFNPDDPINLDDIPY